MLLLRLVISFNQGSGCYLKAATFDNESRFSAWRLSFTFPAINLDMNDAILWERITNPKTWDIWDSIRA